MKVLLVGSSGLIGSQLLRRFACDGHAVKELNSDAFLGKGFFDFKLVRELLEAEKFDWVFTTAWNTEKSSYRDSNQNALFSDATVNLALHSKEFGVKAFVALGSAAEYGSNNQLCNAQTSELNYEDEYARTKVLTYRNIVGLLKGSDTSYLWCRVFQPYGPRQDSSRLLPLLIDKLSRGEFLTLDYPHRGADWISVTDIVDGILFAVENQIQGAIDLGTGRLTSNQELQSIVAKKFNLSLHISGECHSGQTIGLSVSTDSPLFNLGWRPSTQLEDGISNLIKGSL
jgi:nucleoside-diphosphate-sugar epimerase